MKGRCDLHESGAIVSYFYGELPAGEHAATELHLAACAECREQLEDLATIRQALGDPKVVAPPRGDWSGFMRRLDEAVRDDAEAGWPEGESGEGSPPLFRSVSASPGWSFAGLIAAAALLSVVTAGVTAAIRFRQPSAASPMAAAADPGSTTERADGAPGFTALSEEHFERSKLVVLGLATKDPARSTSKDWTYERELATRLLSDTRLYRHAAENRGLRSIAGVMRDLELVLIQASFTDARDPASLSQIQSLIRKRDLVEKLDTMATAGL